MKQKTKEIVTLTPKLAEELLKYNRFEHQRKINDERVSYLINAIKQGLFTGADIALATNGNEAIYLVNGQHCCKAVLESQQPIKVTLSKYECDDILEVSQLYRQFDTPLSTRTITEVLNIERDILDRRHWKGCVASLLVSGAILLESYDFNIKRFKITRDMRADILKRYLKHGDIIDQLFDGDYKILKRVPVVAVMIGTINKRRHTAEIFWINVRDGSDLKRWSPELKLRDYLYVTSLEGGKSKREMLVKCIHAWNAFIKNESTKLTYHPTAKIPKIL